MSSDQKAMCTYFDRLSLPWSLIRYFLRNKAVSDGALSFYLDHFVKTRVSKVAYGSFCHIPYDSSNSEHLDRQSSVFTSVSNAKRIGGYFQVVLPKASISWADLPN